MQSGILALLAVFSSLGQLLYLLLRDGCQRVVFFLQESLRGFGARGVGFAGL